MGGYLAQHPGISHVHITGSAATHDLIVWGRGEEAAERRAAGTPLLSTPITSELGGVSPIIVVPGDWSAADLAFQAEHVATQRLHNGGYNCIAGQVVVLSSDWPQREAFVEQLRVAMAKAPGREAWYPESGERVASAMESYADAERLGPDGGRLLVDARGPGAGSVVQTTEYFSPCSASSTCPAPARPSSTPPSALVNDDFVGTLGANVLVDPATLKDLGEGFEEAIARLRVRHGRDQRLDRGRLPHRERLVGRLPRAHPRGRAERHRRRAQRHAARRRRADRRPRPFRPFPRSAAGGEFALTPKPPWFVTARSARTTGELLTRFAADPSWAKLPGIFASAFKA